MDVAGTVRAVGTDVKAFRPGDKVMGNVSESSHGGFAEYVCAPPEAIVPKPSDVSFVDAAAVPTAAVTALQGLRDDGGIRSGDDVLVHGASGGVGTFAVQLAASFGAKVTGVCSTQKGETVRSIGADRVVDYTSEDVTAGDRQYDLILDSAAAHSIRAYSRVLREGGRYVMVGGPAGRFVKVQLFGPLFSRILQKQIGPFEMEVSGTDLAAIADHLGAGILTPVVDRTFPLEETPAAMRYLEAGRACGKIVIVMNDDPGG